MENWRKFVVENDLLNKARKRFKENPPPEVGGQIPFNRIGRQRQFKPQEKQEIKPNWSVLVKLENGNTRSEDKYIVSVTNLMDPAQKVEFVSKPRGRQNTLRFRNLAKLNAYREFIKQYMTEIKEIISYQNINADGKELERLTVKLDKGGGQKYIHIKS
tara:strand:- start:15457 stop:15933 length:477 start_codon:yes stop_codon:yes gene_type:complete